MLKLTISKFPELAIFGFSLPKSRVSAISTTVFHANLITSNIWPRVDELLTAVLCLTYGVSLDSSGNDNIAFVYFSGHYFNNTWKHSLQCKYTPHWILKLHQTETISWSWQLIGSVVLPLSCQKLLMISVFQSCEVKCVVCLLAYIVWSVAMCYLLVCMACFTIHA